MPRHRAGTQADFEAGEAINVRATLDGLAVLSGRNKADNPDFADPNPTDPGEAGARGHTLGAAPAYDGWGVLARKRAALNNGVRTPVRGTVLAKQNAAPLPWERASYRQEGPLVNGGEPTGSPLPLYRLPRPSVKLAPKTDVGYANRHFGIALAGVVGQLGRSPARLLTAPSPRVYANPAAGQSIRAYLGEAQQGWIGIAVLMTAPQLTQAAAQTAPLLLQRVLDIREAVPEYYDLTGPLRRDDVAPTANETFIAGLDDYEAPIKRLRYAPGMLRPLSARFSYQLRRRDHPGWSARQQFSALITVAAERPNEALAFRLPDGIPRAAHQWRLIMETPDNSLAAFGALNPDAEQLVYTADLAKYPQGARPVSVESPETDETGVEEPTSAPDEPLVFGSAALPPGDYEVRVYGTKNIRETQETREGPVSDYVLVTLPESAPGSGVSSHTFTVQAPDANIVFNPRYVEEDADGADSGWERPAIAGVSYEVLGRGNVAITDRSGSTTNEYVRLARETRPVDPTIPYTLSVPLTLLDRTGGRANAAVFFYNGADQQIAVATLGGAAALGKTRVMKSVGPTGSGADVLWPAGTVGVRPALQLVGATDGARNFALKKGPIGIYPGLAAPQLTLAEEEAGDPRNPGGYCRVLPPADSEALLPAGLTGRGVRVMEYYGPLNSVGSARYGPTGFKMAVAAGVRYAESIYLWWQGVTNAANALVLAVKNAKGETLDTLPPFQAAMLGASGWLRKEIDFTAPEGAAYLELVAGNLSDGLVRIAAIQHEESSTGVATAYDNANALSGSLAAILDTEGAIAPPGVHVPVQVENPIMRWIRAGSVHDNAESGATTVEVGFASGATPAEADAADTLWDFEQVSPARYLKVLDVLTTTDATESPEIDELYLDTVRRDPILTREDGSEFPGGVRVGNLPPPDPDPGTVEEEMASGKVRTREMRPERRWLRGLELLCYRQSAREEVGSYAKRARRAAVEGDGMRRTVEIPGEISWEYDRDAWLPMRLPNGALDPDGWYLFRATVDAEIVEEATL